MKAVYEIKFSSMKLQIKSPIKNVRSGLNPLSPTTPSFDTMLKQKKNIQREEEREKKIYDFSL